MDDQNSKKWDFSDDDARLDAIKEVAENQAAAVRAEAGARVGEAEARFGWRTVFIKRLMWAAILVASFYLVPNFWSSLPQAVSIAIQSTR